jgi:hypothetical protein
MWALSKGDMVFLMLYASLLRGYYVFSSWALFKGDMVFQVLYAPLSIRCYVFYPKTFIKGLLSNFPKNNNLNYNEHLCY